MGPDNLADDLRPRMAALLDEGRAFALVTAFAVDGGPRGVGTQMVVTETDCWGFVSGGCVEADVALHARDTLADGQPRTLVYGRGSPWMDIALPCGGRLDLLAERISPDDTAVVTFVSALQQRRTVRYQSDGRVRRCSAPDGAPAAEWAVDHVFAPPQRLIVVGSDAIAMAIAGLGSRLGWASVLINTDESFAMPELGVVHRSDPPDAALASMVPDGRTAIAVATHDLEHDEVTILAALATGAGYIGVLGARRRIPERVDRLRRAGVSEADIARLHMPIGLPLGAASPWEIAVSVTAQIIAERSEA